MAAQVVWVTGHSGVGKSTLCSGLADILNCGLISVGEIIRATYPKTCEIPDSKVFEIIHDQLTKRHTNLVLIDDFPFNKNQYKTWLELYPFPICVLHLEDGQNGQNRKLKRGRKDDSEIHTTIRKLRFENEIFPILEHLKHKNLLYHINTSEPPRKCIETAYKIIRNIFMEFHISFCDISKLIVEKHNELAQIPIKKYPFSAGYDVNLIEPIVLQAHKTSVNSIGLSVELGARTVAIVFGRSSIASRGVLVHPGIIDPAYSQDLKIILTNLTAEDIFLDTVDPVAQLLILPTLTPEIIEAVTLKVGRGGFGSSNHNGNLYE